MSTGITTWHDRYLSVMASKKKALDKAKQVGETVTDNVLAGAGAAGCGILDQAKGTEAGASGITQHKIGPVPTSLAAAAICIGAGVALEASGEKIGRQVAAMGTGALAVSSYVAARNAWATHAANSGQ